MSRRTQVSLSDEMNGKATASQIRNCHSKWQDRNIEKVEQHFEENLNLDNVGKFRS